MDTGLEARVCQVCGKPKGTTAFRFTVAGQVRRGYFHVACFKMFKDS